MVLPLVPVIIVVGTVATAGAGAAVGGIGGVQISIAQKRIRRHAQRHEKRHNAHLARVKVANDALRRFGQTQELAQQVVIFRMRDFLERHAKQVLAHEHLILDGVDGANTQVVGMGKLDPDVAGWVRGVVGSVIAGAATPIALRSAAGGFAKASTGTSLSALHGVASQNATLAFFGGGSLLSGGGGVKLGKTMLGVAMIGPAVLIAGVALKNQGTKARTGAETYKAEVDVAIAALDSRDEILRGVLDRAGELDDTLHRLIAQATGRIGLLESEAFDINHHAERLQAALILVKSVRDVATALVIDANGNLDQNGERLVFKYRDTTEAARG